MSPCRSTLQRHSVLDTFVGTMRAVGGVKYKQARGWQLRAPLARSSSTWPISTNVTITAAASKYSSTCP